MDILQTLGGATLATTTVVLGASMFPQTKTSQTVDQQVTSGMPLVHHVGWVEGGGGRGAGKGVHEGGVGGQGGFTRGDLSVVSFQFFKGTMHLENNSSVCQVPLWLHFVCGVRPPMSYARRRLDAYMHAFVAMHCLPYSLTIPVYY